MNVPSLALISCREVCPQEMHSVSLKVLILKRLKTSGQVSLFSSIQKKKSLQSCCPILSLLDSLLILTGRFPSSNNMLLGATFCVRILVLSVWIMISFTPVGSNTVEESFPCNQSRFCQRLLPVEHSISLKSRAVKTSWRQLFNQQVSASEFSILLWRFLSHFSLGWLVFAFFGLSKQMLSEIWDVSISFRIMSLIKIISSVPKSNDFL